MFECEALPAPLGVPHLAHWRAEFSVADSDKGEGNDGSTSSLLVAIYSYSTVRMDTTKGVSLGGKSKLFGDTLISTPHSGCSRRVLADTETAFL